MKKPHIPEIEYYPHTAKKIMNWVVYGEKGVSKYSKQNYVTPSEPKDNR